ncbi:NIL domain-containing protein [Crocosphaera sp. UHCC 0190]|uniref:NIL domain-containing protein n=1 Tax=Crocosphaera sp. UHCC 0190 TaxID=3110246 RepID=UPI002B1F61D0|nr:NIL domain-containing protein [Crocosphaera sp. UHCC 0190]MEA5508334.1 NIL domain-containing protein [Crocosphaera sp. UHCC 0190]
MSSEIVEQKRQIERRIKIQIPPEYHQDPIISQLATFYHLKISIVGAMLGQDSNGSGWFDLELQGEYQQIENALLSLRENNIIIWDDSNEEYDGW